MRLADYIADFFVERGIRAVFSVVGGGAMYLNDAFGANESLQCIYNHHEQACTMAAEAYSRITGVPAIACVTSGPGGTNALTGVLCAWQDSLPVIIVSGQVRYATTVESTGLALRQFGEQEYTIIPSVAPMTKYAHMIVDPSRIRYHLEKAWWHAMEGRKGPVWLDVPLDIQNSQIEPDELEGYSPAILNYQQQNIGNVLASLSKAERPVILAGSGIRSSGAYEIFKKVVERLGMPVLAATSVADLFCINEKVYCGNFGVFGGRAGNSIVQNADLLLAVGCSLSFKHTGFNYEKFAEKAKIIVVNVDPEELQKPTLNIDIPIWSNLNSFFKSLLDSELPAFVFSEEWLQYCFRLKNNYPIFQPKFEQDDAINPYYVAKRINEALPDNSIEVLGNSIACVCSLQMGISKNGQRKFGNINCGTMGYDLPASIGASIASGSEVFCLTGDGSIMMNLQELQTISSNKLPIKIVVFNNNGYHALTLSQMAQFGRLTGCTSTSGLVTPGFEKIANAFGISYYRASCKTEFDQVLDLFLDEQGAALFELSLDYSQSIEPKVTTRKKEDGTLYSPPIHDMFPFLEAEEISKLSYDWKG